MLVCKPSGYYLYVTCYLPQEHFRREPVAKVVGIDFGVDWKLTFSNGIKIEFEVHETPRLKRLQKRLAGTKKNSRNREKTGFFSGENTRG